MKKLITLFFMILLTQVSFAESGKGCDRAGKLTEKLDLQDDQIEAVQQIMSEQQEKRREIFEANRDSMKKKMDSLHNDTKDKLNSVLSPEQMAEFEKLHAKRMEKREQRREKRKEHFKETSQTIENESNDVTSF